MSPTLGWGFARQRPRGARQGHPGPGEGRGGAGSDMPGNRPRRGAAAASRGRRLRPVLLSHAVCLSACTLCNLLHCFSRFCLRQALVILVQNRLKK